jgi:hypothetical protein
MSVDTVCGRSMGDKEDTAVVEALCREVEELCCALVP